MAAVDYQGAVEALVRLLRDHPDLADVYVTDDPQNPAEMQAPAILVAIHAFQRTPRWIVGRPSSGTPFEETVSLTLTCWTFSGQGCADAARQRDALVSTVLDVLESDISLGGWADDHTVVRGELQLGGENESIHASARLLLEAKTRA